MHLFVSIKMAVSDKANSVHLKLNNELYTNTSCHFIGVLSPKSKHLLTLPDEERKGVAFSALLTEIENMKAFSMFSNQTKELMAKKLRFVTHKASESLLLQGEVDEPLQAFYIILSGVLSEQYKPSAKDEESTPVWPEKILQKGDFLGHVDIVHNRPPTANVRTVGYSELLMLKKADFYIIRPEIEVHCTRITQLLRTSESISRFQWSDEEYKVLEIYSKLCTYTEGQVVYNGAGDNNKFWSYFIVLGECKVLRELAYIKNEFGCPKSVPHQLRKELKTDKMVTDLVEFEEVKQGFFFGVGEKFADNQVVARSPLECLVIPRLILVFKDKELLRKMAKDLTDSLPSDQEVLDHHAKLVTASKKTVEIFQDLLQSKPEMLIKN